MVLKCKITIYLKILRMLNFVLLEDVDALKLHISFVSSSLSLLVTG